MAHANMQKSILFVVRPRRLCATQDHKEKHFRWANMGERVFWGSTLNLHILWCGFLNRRVPCEESR
jgi:hypothetical protein